jgi:transcriptional regulator with XRE-family HTH domain
MAARRRELAQRRKAVGFTQESLAEHLGVERSTVIRWEAGDSEPLPSIRPNLARALQVSIEQLAELLTESVTAGATRDLAADPEVTIPALLPDTPPQGRSDETEFENLIQPQIAETVEVLRRALQSAGVTAEDLAALLLVGGSPPGLVVPPGLGVSDLPRSEAPDMPAPRWMRSRRRKRLVVAGAFALALPSVWLSAPFVTSHSGAIPPVAAGSHAHAIPVGAVPAPNLGASHDNSASAAPTGATAPTEPPAPPAGGPAPPAVPASHTTRVSAKNRIASQSIHSVHTTRPPLSPTQAWMIATAQAGHRWHGVDQVEWTDHSW